jgi:hypothetical protein
MGKSSFIREYSISALNNKRHAFTLMVVVSTLPPYFLMKFSDNVTTLKLFKMGIR